MKQKLLLALVVFLLVMSVLVDFTSKFMSMAADGLLVGLAVFFAWMLFNDSKPSS